VGESYDYLVRARILAERRQAAQSREAVDWALAHAEPGDVDVPVVAGMVLLMLGDAHAALTVGLRASASGPGRWEPYVLVADAYRLLDRRSDSVAAARRAVALAPQEAEAHVALARALGEGRRHRAERAAAAARAVELGADPAQVARRRWTWLPVAVPAVCVVLPLIAGGWALGVALLGLALTAAALRVAEVRWSGTTLTARLQSVRALARAELAADPDRPRRTVLNTGALLAVLPFAATGFACAAGAHGRPWPAWLAALAVLGAGAVLGGLVLAVRWWYGADFVRRHILPSRMTSVHLLAAAVLMGTTLALSLAEPRSPWWWTGAFAAHLAWFLGALSVTAVLIRRPAPEPPPSAH
jgi:hypothetical protein